MSTVGALIDRLYREWLTPGDQVPVLATLDGAINDSVTSLTLDTSTMPPDEQSTISPGTLIEIGLENILVTDFTPSSGAVTGVRGYGGTTATSHADDAVVFPRPRFARQAAFDAVADEIVSLHPPLWGYGTATVTSGDAPIDVDADVVGVASVQWEDTSNHVQNGTALLIRNYPPSATGRAVNVRGIPKGKTVYLTLKKEFARPTTEADTLADLGVEEQWSQIVVLGAAARMSAYVDPTRLHHDWVTEVDQQQANPVGTATVLSRRLMSMRNDLVEAAARRLRMEYPPVMTWNDPFDPMQRV